MPVARPLPAPVKAALDKAGGRAALAGLAGVSPQAVSLWEYVPLEHLAKVSFLLDIPPEVLRPDLHAALTTGKRLPSPDITFGAVRRPTRRRAA